MQAYGAQAIFGRAVGAGEIKRMNTAVNIVAYYKQKHATDNQAKWALDNPMQDSALNRAFIAAKDAGLLDGE